MKLYLVRHAQTIGNASRIHQTPDTPLSDKGEKQIVHVANRFKTIPIDIIVASPYKRTQHTAQEIAKVTGKEIISTPLLRETERPSEIHNKSIDDPEVIKIKEEIKKHINDQDWHYSDEENFFDLLERIKQLISFIEELPYENVVAVSHGGIIKLFVCYLLVKEHLTPKLLNQMKPAIATNNTGVTLLERDEEGEWAIRTLNDLAHLGDD